MNERVQRRPSSCSVACEGAWEAWLLYTLAAHTTGHVRRQFPKIYSRELVNIVFERPYCRIANLVNVSGAERQAAFRYLKALALIGVLREQTFGRRSSSCIRS